MLRVQRDVGRCDGHEQGGWSNELMARCIVRPTPSRCALDGIAVGRGVGGCRGADDRAGGQQSQASDEHERGSPHPSGG